MVLFLFVTWEQRKLGDVAKINMGQSPDGVNYTTNPNDAILVQGNADMADGWVSPRVYTKQITKKAHVGDLIFSVRAPVGEVGKTQYNVVIGRGVAAISGNEFIFQSLKRMNIFGYWTKLSAGSTFESINTDTLKAAEFAIPKEDEQIKIGEILLKIDNLITLHQRKQKCNFWLFVTPKAGSFLAHSWEQRKLREVFDYERPDTYIVKSDKYSDTYSTPVLTANKGFILGYTNEMQVCNKECIIFDDFTLDSKYVTFPFMVKSSALKILTAKIGYFLPFAYQLLQATNIEILGHARHYISVVQPTKVLIPSNDEQIRIGKCIQQIDNLITLHQRKEFLGDCYSSIFNAEDKSKKVANAWEQRKLCSIATKVIEKNENTRIVETFTNSAEFGIISQRDYFDHDISNFDNLSGYYVVQNNDFVYNPRISVTAPVGPINRNKLGRKGVMSPLYMVFRASNIDFTFMEWYFKSEHWHGFMKFNGDSGARSDRFSIKDEIMFQMPLPYPNIHEQELVGEILLKIDNLITLHQREHSVKKSSKLSKKHLGDKVLFANAWEQRKAEKLFISYVEKGFPELPVLSATQDKGMVYRDDTGKSIFHDKSNEIGYKRVQPGQFVIHLRSFQGGFAHSAILGITSPAYTIFGFKEGEKQCDLYWKYVFSSSEFVRRLETVTYGIRDGRSISYDEFLTMKFIVPRYEEQVKIANILIELDNLITLHQRRLIKIQGDKNGKKRSFRRIVQRLF